METTMKKGKGVAVSISDESLDKKKSDPSAMSAGRISARNASSKYDFVKVKVWLGDNADHYYVLSRFLLSRMLTVTKIPNHVAIKIALELKKLLIDNSLLDVSQSDLEVNLFKLMERRGYGEEYINRYRMMTRFHHQRVPLVILVCGTACAGKSTIATQLAQRLNLPNVLQTDMVYELLRTSTDAPLVSNPVWARDFNSPEELITEFCRECRIVRKGLAGDLKKAMKDGKPIIIEGIHIDPSIYLMDEEKTTNSNTRKDETNMMPITSNDNNGAPIDHSTEVSSGGLISSTIKAPVLEDDKSSPNVEDKEEGMLDSQSADVRDHPGCVGLGDSTCPAVENGSVHQGETLKEPDPQTNSPVKKEKPAAEPIIVPIVLKMAEFDHKALLEEWISTRTFGDKCLTQDHDKLISNLKTIQDYLCSFESRGLTVVNISATTFPQTLDWLHSHLLQCIEKGIIAAEARSNAQDNLDVENG